MKMLVFGSLNIDHSYRMPHMVREGETLSSTSYQRNAGGKGLNQAIALARAGQQVIMAGAIGADGLFLKEYLDEFGVDTSLIRTIDEATGHAIIQLDADSQNAIVLYGGANQQMTVESVCESLSSFGEGDHILLQNEINLIGEIVSRAKAKGMKVILNPSPMSDNLLPLMHQVDWLILNEIEGEAMTGMTEPDTILDILLERYSKCRIALTLGANGSMYADKTQRIFQPAVKVKAADTTAAGDTFTGFFFQSLLAGNDIPYALKLAANASAIAVTRPGAGGSIPSREEVLAKL